MESVTISLSQKGPHEMYDTELLAHVCCYRKRTKEKQKKPEEKERLWLVSDHAESLCMENIVSPSTRLLPVMLKGLRRMRYYSLHAGSKLIYDLSALLKQQLRGKVLCNIPSLYHILSTVLSCR